MILLGILVLRELLELEKCGWSYFKLTENYIQIISFSTSAIFIILAPHNTVAANHFGAWAVFISWVNLVQFLGKISFAGRTITIALDVSVKMVKILIVFTPSLFAFIFGFNMMLNTSPLFHDLREAIVKIFAMMTGEFGFDTTFSYKAVRETGGRNFSTQVYSLIQESPQSPQFPQSLQSPQSQQSQQSPKSL